MDPKEIQRLNEIKRLNDLAKLSKQMQELRKTLEQVKEAKKYQEEIRKFLKENQSLFRPQGNLPTGSELEKIREQAGYDKEMWAAIVKELSS